MSKKTRKPKPPAKPGIRGHQLLRGLAVVAFMGDGREWDVYRLQKKLPAWCTRTLRRDLKILEAMGWATVAYKGRAGIAETWIATAAMPRVDAADVSKIETQTKAPDAP